MLKLKQYSDQVVNETFMKPTFKKIPVEKQNRVIEAAFREFALCGYENASTNRIIKNLNISKGSLFKYFSTKIDLYTFLVNSAVERLLKHLEQHNLTGNDWKESLLNYAAIEFDFLIKEPTVYQFFYRMIEELDHPQLEEVKNELSKISNRYLMEIYSSINLKEKNDELFMLHLSFILKGYNEHFLKSMSFNEITINKKNEYLVGLKKHFDLVGGYYEKNNETGKWL